MRWVVVNISLRTISLQHCKNYTFFNWCWRFSLVSSAWTVQPDCPERRPTRWSGKTVSLYNCPAKGDPYLSIPLSSSPQRPFLKYKQHLSNIVLSYYGARYCKTCKTIHTHVSSYVLLYFQKHGKMAPVAWLSEKTRYLVAHHTYQDLLSRLYQVISCYIPSFCYFDK